MWAQEGTLIGHIMVSAGPNWESKLREKGSFDGTSSSYALPSLPFSFLLPWLNLICLRLVVPARICVCVGLSPFYWLSLDSSSASSSSLPAQFANCRCRSFNSHSRSFSSVLFYWLCLHHIYTHTHVVFSFILFFLFFAFPFLWLSNQLCALFYS